MIANAKTDLANVGAKQSSVTNDTPSKKSSLKSNKHSTKRVSFNESFFENDLFSEL
jgi:hypothetical protein